LVFAEAHAFGLPAISRAVQAVPSIILDGQTGIVEPEHAPAESYIRRIRELAENRNEYRRMAHAARKRYVAALNWEQFAEGIIQTISGSL